MKVTPETQALAQNILDFIHEYPEKHSQETFFGDRGCGTTMCIAGTALYLTYGISTLQEFSGSELYDLDDSISGSAGELLGLETSHEIDHIFYEMNPEEAIQKLKHLVTGDVWAFTSSIFKDEEEE